MRRYVNIAEPYGYDLDRSINIRGYQSLGSLGQSAASNGAVKKLQNALTAKGFELGQIDGRYGKNTHAALLRACRDVLEPDGTVTSECRSTCNTLWLRAEAACGTCISSMLLSLNAKWPNLSLSGGEVTTIVNSYKEFLHAYVDQYGDGGIDDPAQVARREDVSLDEATQLVAERQLADDVGAEDVASGVSVTPVSDEGTTQVASVESPAESKKAGLGWIGWSIVVLGVGGLGYYLYKRSQEDSGSTSPEEVSEYSGLGCGCGR